MRERQPGPPAASSAQRVARLQTSWRERRAASTGGVARPGRMADAAPPVLAVEGLGKSFPGVRALNGCSLRRARRRGPCAAGRERRRQIDADQDRVRRLPAGQPARSSSTASARRLRSPDDARARRHRDDLSGAAAVPGADASPRTSSSAMRRGPAAGGIDWRAMRARARELLASLDIDDLDADGIGRHALGRQPAARRDRRALSQDARVLIMDEPTAALTEHDVKRLFDIVRRLQRARRRHRLHQPPPGRDLRARRPGHGAARRRARRRPRAVAETSERELVADDGRPRHRQPVPKRRRRGRRSRCSKCATSSGAR